MGQMAAQPRFCLDLLAWLPARGRTFLIATYQQGDFCPRMKSAGISTAKSDLRT